MLFVCAVLLGSSLGLGELSVPAPAAPGGEAIMQRLRDDGVSRDILRAVAEALARRELPDSRPKDGPVAKTEALRRRIADVKLKQDREQFTTALLGGRVPEEPHETSARESQFGCVPREKIAQITLINIRALESELILHESPPLHRPLSVALREIECSRLDEIRALLKEPEWLDYRQRQTATGRMIASAFRKIVLHHTEYDRLYSLFDRGTETASSESRARTDPAPDRLLELLGHARYLQFLHNTVREFDSFDREARALSLDEEGRVELWHWLERTRARQMQVGSESGFLRRMEAIHGISTGAVAELRVRVGEEGTNKLLKCACLHWLAQTL